MQPLPAHSLYETESLNSGVQATGFACNDLDLSFYICQQIQHIYKIIEMNSPLMCTKIVHQCGLHLVIADIGRDA